MPRLRLVLVVLLVGAAPAVAQQGTPATPALDFDYFKARVQPIFTTKRAGNARCIACHVTGTPMRLQPLAPGSATWSDSDARKNFELVRSRVVAGQPEISRLLRHPLEEHAGGDPHHDGGKHWTTKDDPEWQTLAAWVRGATLRAPPAAGAAPGPRCGSSRPTAPATTSTSSTRRPTAWSARLPASRSATARPRRPTAAGST